MRMYVECMIYACMLVALYFNLTILPNKQPIREVRGILEKVKNEPTN